MVRHNHHATNPEKLIPKMLATPVRLPMAANWPMVEKENGFMTPPRTDAIRCTRSGCQVLHVADGPAIAHAEGHIALAGL